MYNSFIFLTILASMILVHICIIFPFYNNYTLQKISTSQIKCNKNMLCEKKCPYINIYYYN